MTSCLVLLALWAHITSHHAAFFLANMLTVVLCSGGGTSATRLRPSTDPHLPDTLARSWGVKATLRV